MQTVTCNRCNGNGEISTFRHIANGTCFACGGSGKLDTRTRKSYQPTRHPHAIENHCTMSEWDALLAAYAGSDELDGEPIRQALRAVGAPHANMQCVTSDQIARAIQAAK